MSEAYRKPDSRLFSVKDEQVSLCCSAAATAKGYFVPENEPENGFGLPEARGDGRLS